MRHSCSASVSANAIGTLFFLLVPGCQSEVAAGVRRDLSIM